MLDLSNPAQVEKLAQMYPCYRPLTRVSAPPKEVQKQCIDCPLAPMCSQDSRTWACPSAGHILLSLAGKAVQCTTSRAGREAWTGEEILPATEILLFKQGTRARVVRWQPTPTGVKVVKPPIKVGDGVVVVASRPEAGWGDVTRGEGGVITRADTGAGRWFANFPSQKNWVGRDAEYALDLAHEATRLALLALLD